MDLIQTLQTVLKRYDIKHVSNKLNVNTGTVKRWIELNKVPSFYTLDLMQLSDMPADYAQMSAKEKDQFFTCEETAKECYTIFLNKLKELRIDTTQYTFVEPSAGSGSFLKLFPADRRIGVDIESKLPEVIVKDYLQWKPDANTKYLVLGNPPFGLRGNLALRFMNHSTYADFVGFILPQIFESNGKGACKKRVNGLHLIHSQPINPNFYFPNGDIVKVNVIFQIWAKYHTVRTEVKTCYDYIKLYSVSDGGTVSSTRNKDMIGKCDMYLPQTCFGEENMRAYTVFHELPKQSGYGIVIHKNKDMILDMLHTTDWSKVAFKSTNGAYNLRFDLINKVLTDAGFVDNTLHP